MLPPRCAMWGAVRNAEGCDVCCGDGALDRGGAVSRRYGASRADPGRLADDAAHTGSPTRSSGPPAGCHSADPAAAAEGHAPGGPAAAGPPAFRREGAVLSAGASEAGIDRPLIARAGIEAAERLIRPYIRRTPVIRVDAGDLGISFEPGGAPLVLKLEFLQHTGSFKPRGAFASLLSRPAPPAGVVAASGGNHGAAVAYAAMRLGIRATIFVPQVTAPAKLDRIRGYGAELIVKGALYADALRASQDFAERNGALQVHAYDQPETLLGQGTVGSEIEADAAEIDTLLVAAGGGGLIGGIAAWYEGRIRLVAVEPEGAPTLHNALAAGQSRRCAGWWHRRRFAGARTGRRADVPAGAALCRTRRTRRGRGDPRGAAPVVVGAPHRGRAGRRRGNGGAHFGALSARARRADRRRAVRRQYRCH